MILMMGIAGSGKGTQGKMLADNRGLKLISMGDVVREHATPDQRERMTSGVLLGDEEIIAMLDQALQNVPEDQEVLLDGFPRTIPQAEWLMEQVKQGRFPLSTAFHLVASEEVVRERLLGRARVDDKTDAIDERFREYERATAPIIDWLKQHDVDVVDINAERTVEEINQDLVDYLERN